MGGAEFLGAPKAPRKMFLSKLTGTEGSTENLALTKGPEEYLAQSFRKGVGGWVQGGMGGVGWGGNPPPPSGAELLKAALGGPRGPVVHAVTVLGHVTATCGRTQGYVASVHPNPKHPGVCTTAQMERHKQMQDRRKRGAIAKWVRVAVPWCCSTWGAKGFARTLLLHLCSNVAPKCIQIG